MVQKHHGTCNITRNTEKGEKWEMHTVELGVWQGNWKSWKMRNTHCMMWNMARNTEKPEKWEIDILGPGIWRENWKTWKMRHKHCGTSNVVRNTEKHGIQKFKL